MCTESSGAVAELAWAAGIFEGEGSMSIQLGTPQMAVAMSDKDVVEHFAHVLGLREPRPKKVDASRKPQWDTRASGDKALAALGLIEPWLHARRRARLEEIRGIREAIRAPRPCDLCGEVYAPKRIAPSGKNICSQRCRDRLRAPLRWAAHRERKAARAANDQLLLIG